MNVIKGLSKREVEIIANLEFNKRYFFTSGEIDKFSKNKTQKYNIIKNLIKKKRIIKLNKKKYYLVPIKAKSGSWAESSFALIDEVCNGKDYFIGGWAAANYWKLTEQIPMRFQVYTTKRQGEAKILTTEIIFKRTTKKRLKKSVTEYIEGHPFRILNRKESKKWIKSRS